MNKKEKLDGIDNDGNGYIDDINGFNFVENESDTDVLGHGTHVAGVIGARKGGYYEGGNPFGKIMVLKVLDKNGVAVNGAVTEAVNYAISKKVDIINISLSGSVYYAPLYRALLRASANNIVIVVAAGNESLDLDKTPRYPASYPNVKNMVVVGNASNSGVLASNSNYGSVVDFYQPGDNIGAFVFNKTEPDFMSGTSQSAARISGFISALGLVMSEMTYKKATPVRWLNAAKSNVVKFPSLDNKGYPDFDKACDTIEKLTDKDWKEYDKLKRKANKR